MTIKEFLISPYLWNKAHREYYKHLKTYNKTIENIPSDVNKYDFLVKAYEPCKFEYDNSWKYFGPTYVMLVVYGFLFIVIASVVFGALKP